MANKYKAQARAARAETSKIISCSRKQAFATEQLALECQPAQRAYRCHHCRQWHLTAGVKIRRRKQ